MLKVDIDEEQFNDIIHATKIIIYALGLYYIITYLMLNYYDFMEAQLWEYLHQ